MEAKISKLLKWLKNSAQFQISDAIEVIDTADSGRGVYLQKPTRLKKNDTLISIPSSYQLNFHTVLYHISKFNNSISIPGITISEEDNIKYSKYSSENQDPRYKAYAILSQEFLLQLSSFQLLGLYVLAEWILLPQWITATSTNNDISTNDTPLESFWQPFFDVWPTLSELGSIPTIWNCQRNNENFMIFDKLIKSLPYASQCHMNRISKLVCGDWNTIFPIIEKWNKMYPLTTMTVDDLFNKFLKIYFIINSRCLYCEIPVKKDSVDRITSNFTMVPLVDFLNHSDKTDFYCYPYVNNLKKDKISGIGQFEIHVGDHEYNQLGEQIFLNYGAHSNDFLLNEYGFVLNENCWDFIDISDQIEKLLNKRFPNLKKQNNVIKFLKENEYWDDYTLNKNEISYRTLIVLSLIITEDFDRVRKFMNGYISEDFFLPKIKETLLNLLKDILSDSINKINDLEKLCSETSDAVISCYCKNIITIYKNYIDILQHHVYNL